MPRLPKASYLKFPFRVEANGVATSSRSQHVREQIEQVLFTNQYERVFRPEFGAGIRQIIFEPNKQALWELLKKRLTSTLVDVLQGEVDPRSLQVDINGLDELTGMATETIQVLIRYELAAIGQQEEHLIPVSINGVNHG